jgi:hypothetical protein
VPPVGQILWWAENLHAHGDQLRVTFLDSGWRHAERELDGSGASNRWTVLPRKARTARPQRQQSRTHAKADPIGPIHLEREFHDVELELAGLCHALAKQDHIVDVADRP